MNEKQTEKESNCCWRYTNKLYHERDGGGGLKRDYYLYCPICGEKLVHGKCFLKEFYDSQVGTS